MSWNIAKPGDQINGPVAVTGNLNVDSNTLFVDSANNRVGVLTASPTVPLDVVGAASVSGVLTVSTGTAAAPAISFAGDPDTGIYSGAANSFSISTGGAERMYVSSASVQIFPSGSAAAPAFSRLSDNNTGFYFPAADTFGLVTGGVERVRVDSAGRVGIGTTTPIPYAANARVLHIDGGANNSEIRLTNNTTGTANTDGGLLTMSGSNLYVWNNENASVIFGTNNGTKATLDGSGNLGLGVTLNTWAAVFRAIQFPDGYAAIAGDNGNGVAEITSNAYNDGAWKFRNAQGAVRYRLDAINKTHTWFNTSTTPTANGAITWTPAMVLDASGNLALGTSTANFRADIQNASGAAVLRLKGGTGAAQGSAVYMTYAGGANTLLGIGDRATILGGTPDQLACIYSGVALTFEINGAERLRLKTTGQVNFVGLSSDPAGAAAGDVYYNTTTNKLKCYNGTTWNDLF